MTLVLDAPVTIRPTATVPLSLPTARYRAALDDGAVVVDLRDETTRRTDGALLGALAVSADDALDLLTPGAAGALRGASLHARWVLVTDDGYDAEQLAWHLQARGVSGARFVLGGHRALRAAGLATSSLPVGAHDFFG